MPPFNRRSSTEIFTPREKSRPLSFSSLEDEAVFYTPRSSPVISPTLITDPPSPVYAVPPSSPVDDGNSQLLASLEIPTADLHLFQEHQESEQHSEVNIHTAAATNYKYRFIPIKQAPATGSHKTKKPSRSRDHKSHNFSSPCAPSSSKITVEYNIPSNRSVQEYQKLLSKFHLHAAAAANYQDAFDTIRQISPETGSHNTTMPSGSRDHKSHDFSSTWTPSAKGKRGMLGFMTDFLNSSKRPEISTPYDPVHLTHVGFNSSTGEFTGLPEEWQQLLQDSGISKSDQEKNPLAVREIHQEGGGDV